MRNIWHYLKSGIHLNIWKNNSMARRRLDNDVKVRMWASLLKAAKNHHNTTADHGMVTQIAKDAGVSKASVSEWKNQVSYPEDATLRKLADLYRVPAERLAGYDSPVGDVGPADELMRRATDVTEKVLAVMLPDASLEQFIKVAQRANELVLQGMDDTQVKGHLFEEVEKMRENDQL